MRRLLRPLVAGLLAVPICVSVLIAATTLGGPLPAPLPLFPVDNWWNTDISAAPLDPNSNAYITFINDGSVRRAHPDFGGDVSPGSVQLRAGTPEGLYRGVQTLRQLLPAKVEHDSVQSGPWAIGAVHIADQPRYDWRGAHLDVARHFLSVDEVKRVVRHVTGTLNRGSVKTADASEQRHIASRALVDHGAVGQ